MILKVPDSMPQAHAACLSVMTATGADTISNSFGFPLPGETGSVASRGSMIRTVRQDNDSRGTMATILPFRDSATVLDEHHTSVILLLPSTLNM